MKARLRELAPAARGNQEAEFTQPSLHLSLCMSSVVSVHWTWTAFWGEHYLFFVCVWMFQLRLGKFQCQSRQAVTASADKVAEHVNEVLARLQLCLFEHAMHLLSFVR